MRLRPLTNKSNLWHQLITIRKLKTTSKAFIAFFTRWSQLFQIDHAWHKRWSLTANSVCMSSPDLGAIRTVACRLGVRFSCYAPIQATSVTVSYRSQANYRAPFFAGLAVAFSTLLSENDFPLHKTGLLISQAKPEAYLYFKSQEKKK